MPAAPGQPPLQFAAGQPEGCYELVAVLIHKGSSASHGHYVAHIREEEAGGARWWRFDDETAELMGAVPTSHPGGCWSSAHAVAS